MKSVIYGGLVCVGQSESRVTSLAYWRISHDFFRLSLLKAGFLSTFVTVFQVNQTTVHELIFKNGN